MVSTLTSGGAEDAHFLGFAGAWVGGAGGSVANWGVEIGADDFWLLGVVHRGKSGAG